MPPIDKPEMEQTDLDPKQQEKLLALHIAEYQALMSRCNYFIAIHVGLWSVILTAATFTVQNWFSSNEVTFVWIGGLAIQGLLHIWVTLIEDQYLAVSYIENILRDSIDNAISASSPANFWRYEKFLQGNRPKASWWGEWIVPVVLLVAMIFAVFWRWNFIASEWLFVIPNAILLIALFVRTYWRVKLRKSIIEKFKSKADDDLVKAKPFY